MNINLSKKICITILLSISILYNHSFVTSATETSQLATISESFDDGSYIETTISESSDISPFSTLTKTGRKTSKYKNSSGTVLWSITVIGSFSYNGTSAKCTSSSISSTCPSASWKLTNKSSYYSGATATAKATAKRYYAGECIQTLTRYVTLTCSKSGVLS